MIDAGQLLPKVQILGLGKLPNPANQGCREVACCQLPNALIQHRGLPDQSRQTPKRLSFSGPCSIMRSGDGGRLSRTCRTFVSAFEIWCT